MNRITKNTIYPSFNKSIWFQSYQQNNFLIYRKKIESSKFSGFLQKNSILGFRAANNLGRIKPWILQKKNNAIWLMFKINWLKKSFHIYGLNFLIIILSKHDHIKVNDIDGLLVCIIMIYSTFWISFIFMWCLIKIA